MPSPPVCRRVPGAYPFILVGDGANFVGALTGTAVATTIAFGLGRYEAQIDLGGSCLGPGGAIAWNLITWCLGIPSSSSHALIGGLLGHPWPTPGWTRGR